MATLDEKIDAELKFRQLVAEGGLPEPDHVEYGHTCIRVMWREAKLALVIDLDEIGPEVETLEQLGLDPTDLGADPRGEPEFGRGMTLEEAERAWGIVGEDDTDEENEDPHEGWNRAA